MFCVIAVVVVVPGIPEEFDLLLGVSAFVIIGLAGLSMFRKRQIRNLQLHWPQLLGVVKSVEVVCNNVGAFIHSMRPGLSVEYVVNGTTYTRIVYLKSEDIWMTMHFETTAKKIMAEYKEGAEIPVFYSPSDPSLTVIGGVLGRASR